EGKQGGDGHREDHGRELSPTGDCRPGKPASRRFPAVNPKVLPYQHVSTCHSLRAERKAGPAASGPWRKPAAPTSQPRKVLTLRAVTLGQICAEVVSPRAASEECGILSVPEFGRLFSLRRRLVFLDGQARVELQ